MWRLAWLVCLSSAIAMAGPLSRKGATETYPVKALVPFAKGLTAERMGDLTWALDMYEESLGQANEANTHFNIARIDLELEDYSDALAHFEKYLALAPKAPDRAAVEQIIADLKTAKPTLTVGAGPGNDAVDAVILVDGAVIGRSPVVIHPSPGEHFIERVSPYNYSFDRLTVNVGMTKYVELGASARERKGNVLITFARSGTSHSATSWKEGAHTFEIDKVFPLPAGTYRTRLRDEASTRLCKPIDIKVPSTDNVTYVRIKFRDGPGRDRNADCFDADVVIHQLDLRAP